MNGSFWSVRSSSYDGTTIRKRVLLWESILIWRIRWEESEESHVSMSVSFVVR